MTVTVTIRSAAPKQTQPTIRIGFSPEDLAKPDASPNRPAIIAINGRNKRPMPAVDDRDCLIAHHPATIASAKKPALSSAGSILPRKDSTNSTTRNAIGRARKGSRAITFLRSEWPLRRSHYGVIAIVIERATRIQWTAA